MDRAVGAEQDSRVAEEREKEREVEAAGAELGPSSTTTLPR